MSLGYSVGDFITIGQLCWNVYKACKGATGEYEEICKELSTLQICLKELEDEARSPTSTLNRRGMRRKDDMDNILSNISGVLGELDKMVWKYRSLGKLEKRKWDRLRFGAEDLDTMRGKLTFHISSINFFMSSLTAGSLARIEIALEELLVEVKAGRRSPTVLSVQDEETESPDAWRELEAELLDCGISKRDIEKNRDPIRIYIKSLMSGEAESIPNDPMSSSIANFIGECHDSAVSDKWTSISERVLKEEDLVKKSQGVAAFVNSTAVTGSMLISSIVDSTPITNSMPTMDLALIVAPFADPIQTANSISTESRMQIADAKSLMNSIIIADETLVAGQISIRSPTTHPGSIVDLAPTSSQMLIADPAPTADPIANQSPAADQTPIADAAGTICRPLLLLPESVPQVLNEDQTTIALKEPSRGDKSSDFEVMGLVLNVWRHVVLKILALFPYKDMKSSQRTSLLVYEFKTEEIIYMNIVRHLIASDVSEADLVMLSDRQRPNMSLWRDKALNLKIKRRLGHDKTEIVIKTLREMDMFLTGINNKLDSQNIDIKTPPRELGKDSRQLKHDISDKSLRQDLENVRGHNTQLQWLLTDCINSGWSACAK